MLNTMSGKTERTVKPPVWLMAAVLVVAVGLGGARAARQEQAAAPTGTSQVPAETDPEEVPPHRIGEPPRIVMWIETPGGRKLAAPIPIRVVVGPNGSVIAAKFDQENPDDKEDEIPKPLLVKIKAAISLAEAEVRKLHYKPFERDGKPVFVTFEEEVLVLPEDPALARRVDFPGIKNWNSLRIRLERTACFGLCPDYSVEVHGDGTVLYEGNGFVAVTGHHRATIDKKAVAEMFEAFRNADYFSLRDRYQAMITDNPTFNTSIAFDRYRKRIVDYVGLRAGMPLAVTELENKIDELTDSKRWIKGDANTFGSLAAEGFDFKSPEAAEMLARIAQQGSADAVRDLVAAGVPVNDPKSSAPPTPKRRGLAFPGSALENAASRGDVEMLRTLLQADPPPEAKSKNEALSEAAAAGSLDAVKLMLQYGANPDANVGFPAIVAAANSGVPAVVQEILKYKPNILATTAAGETALMKAVNRECCDLEPKGADRPQVVRLLLAAGAEVNARDRKGNTALIENAWDPEIAEVLLQHGANINAQRDDGWTPLFSASSPELARFLLAHGADMSVRDKAGETALDAKRRYSPKVAAVLEEAQGPRKP